MTTVEKALESVLEGYASFLRERMLAPLKHQSYLVRWVQEFFLFAEQHRGYTFEQTLELFLAALGERVGIKPWQIQQAADVKAFLTRLAMVDKVSASTQNQAFRPP